MIFAFQVFGLLALRKGKKLKRPNIDYKLLSVRNGQSNCNKCHGESMCWFTFKNFRLLKLFHLFNIVPFFSE